MRSVTVTADYRSQGVFSLAFWYCHGVYSFPDVEYAAYPHTGQPRNSKWAAKRLCREVPYFQLSLGNSGKLGGQPIENFLAHCNQPMLLPLLQQPVLPAKTLKISPAEAIKNTSQTLTSSTCLTLISKKIFVSTNSMNFVFPSRTPTC
ncbi:hypothetical protein TNCV_4338411 [Trichonephila clavipes]|uniref:Uncharacterized protein n=1 Tax=Trichonephila clavipes TaxID=2585209 RepID=A0A8X6SSD3_TRICX|nr:hypothetical protein TNCV_4338411 [Trichonephila clavipes]